MIEEELKKASLSRQYEGHDADSSRFLTLLYALSLAGYPAVAALSSIFGLNNAALSVGFRIGLFAVSAGVLFEIVTNRIRVARGWIWLPILVFWFFYILRLALDTYVSPESLWREPYRYWLWAIGGSVIPMCAMMGKLGRSGYEAALGWTFKLSMLASLMVLLANYLRWSSGIAREGDVGRLAITSLNPISAGHLGGTLVILGVFLIARVGFETRRWIDRIGYSLSIITGLILLLTSGSRGAMLAVAVSVGVLGLSKMRRKNWLLMPSLVTILVVGSFVLANYLEKNLEFSAMSRVASAFAYEGDASMTIRAKAYGGAWNQFLDSPLIGDAIVERSTGFYPHNVILESLMATGVFGGAAFIVILFEALKRSWLMLRKQASFSWIGLLVIQYVIGAQFSGSLWGATQMWAVVAAGFGACHLLHQRKFRAPLV